MDELQNRALKEAVAGNMAAVREYVMGGGDPNIRDEEGFTLLHYAVRAGDLETVELLLKAGADPNAHDGEGDTPLHVAAKIYSLSRNAERLDRLAWLLAQYGADINARNARGEAPLHYAVVYGNSDMAARALLRRGADPNVKNNVGAAPLDDAVFGSRYETIDALAEAGGKLNSATLFDCLRSERPHLCAEPLLKHGAADPNARDGEGKTALHYAAKADNAVVAAILLRYGADVNAKDHKGKTPLDYAPGRNARRAAKV